MDSRGLKDPTGKEALVITEVAPPIVTVPNVIETPPGNPCPPPTMFVTTLGPAGVFTFDVTDVALPNELEAHVESAQKGAKMTFPEVNAVISASTTVPQ